jgi:ligand-binding sensor domain-containing protein
LTSKDFGLLYSLKYKKKSPYRLKRELDLSMNIPFCLTGRYNLIADGNGGMFFGTRTGVYYGSKKTLKGRRNWTKVGFGLPHCKLNGLHYDANQNSITVGFFGRGVWRYYL